ncbi:MAG TPA: undecaprenyl-diphosphate phosphatase [Streptosporangiaceae bacterium]|jgi:undecaprenyl-diphosphatase|nr:undecaprenyl-diphosphate phosphatase [Streptosporangiaceae bacterium]
MTYPEAMVVGLIQGVTELFPVSSLGHNVLIPALIGGTWARALNVAAPESPYLAFIVGLHVATAIALLIYFWHDWVRIIRGFFTSIRDRDIVTSDQKLAWMIIVATIPVGLAGLLFEHAFRVLFGKPVLAAVFLVVNGLILFSGERFRTKASRQADQEVAEERRLAMAPAEVQREPVAGVAAVGLAGAEGVATVGPPRRPGHGNHAAAKPDPKTERAAELAAAVRADRRLSKLDYLQTVVIGGAQILALLAGISRDGVTMVAGMFRGLAREDAARFAFLLATPVILAAGALKARDLITLGHGIYGPILAGSILSGIGAYVSVRFLVRYFQTRTLTPFAIYCVLFGVGSIIYLQVK